MGVCLSCVTMDTRAGKELEGLYSVVVAYNLNWFNTVYQELESWIQREISDLSGWSWVQKWLSASLQLFSFIAEQNSNNKMTMVKRLCLINGANYCIIIIGVSNPFIALVSLVWHTQYVWPHHNRQYNYNLIIWQYVKSGSMY